MNQRLQKQQILLNYSEILKSWYIYIDQISFCFAMLDLQIPYEILPIEYNFPTHLELSSYKDKVIPKVLHYHRKLNAHGYIETVGISEIDVAVENANRLISEFRKNRINNKIFWDFRYKYYPDLGSGVGSRGDYLEYRKKILYPFFYFFGNKKILDVGCGDLELTHLAECTSYLGIDVSPYAINLAKTKRPDWKYLIGDISYLKETCLKEEKFDLVYCGAVIIHQSTQDKYYKLIKDLVDRTKDTLIIEGYETPPKYVSDITFYYEPLTTTLRKFPHIASIECLGMYRDLHIIMVRKKNLGANSYPFKDLINNIYQNPDREILRDLVQFSLEILKYFPRPKSRIYEYPFIIKEAGDVFKKKILEIEAGINPLPLYFSNKGAIVVTVGNADFILDPLNPNFWNEWGYIDYSHFDKRIKSLNIDAIYIDKLKNYSFESFDIVYSVSTLEHIPAFKRKYLIKKVCKMIKKRGYLLLTVNLIPNTNFLWNYCMGKLIESKFTLWNNR